MGDELPLDVSDLAGNGCSPAEVNHDLSDHARFSLEPLGFAIGKVGVARLHQKIFPGVHPSDLEVHILSTHSHPAA